MVTDDALHPEEGLLDDSLAAPFTRLDEERAAAVLRDGWGLNWAWNIPVTILAITLVGAGQHQLTGLAHEASHHTLFKNRFINDLVSDYCCMFPLFGATQHYRLQHLAHHQFVNDPIHDPDVSQLQTSGHWLNFPVSKKTFLMTLLRQLWIFGLIRYMRIRAAIHHAAKLLEA